MKVTRYPTMPKMREESKTIVYALPKHYLFDRDITEKTTARTRRRAWRRSWRWSGQPSLR